MKISLDLRGDDRRWVDEVQHKLLGHVRNDILAAIAARVVLRSLLYLPPVHQLSNERYFKKSGNTTLFLRSALLVSAAALCNDLTLSNTDSIIAKIDSITPDQDAIGASHASLFYGLRTAFAIDNGTDRRENLGKSALSCLYAYNSFPTTPGGKSQFEIDCLEASKALADGKRLFARRLFGQSVIAELNGFDGELNPLYSLGDSYSFWARWYQAFIDGKPLDIELQRRVASIEDEVWSSGDRVLVERISAIEAKLELETRIRTLENERLAFATDQTRLSIGGNNPPDDMKIESTVVQNSTIIWATIDDLKEEVEKPIPDKASVVSMVTKLGAAAKTILAWAAKKGDLSVDTIIRWGIPAGAATALAKPDLILSVIEAAKAWLAIL